MALTVENAITAIVTQADALAGTSTAEDLVYLAKSLEAVSDTRQASGAAVQAVVDRANGLSSGATSEDLIYLAKAVEALSTASVIADVTAEGNVQVTRVTDEGNTQDSRVLGQGDTQDARVLAEGNTQVGRVITEGDTQVARVATELDTKADINHNHDSLYLNEASNLSDLPNKTTARNNLGLGNQATENQTISTGSPSGGSDGDVWYQV